jgi:hypothetical protein
LFFFGIFQFSKNTRPVVVRRNRDGDGRVKAGDEPVEDALLQAHSRNGIFLYNFKMIFASFNIIYKIFSISFISF